MSSPWSGPANSRACTTCFTEPSRRSTASGPERLKVRQLFERADEANRAGARFEEVVIATNPTLEGEATAMYLAERLEPLVGSVTRIARGLPVGGDLEYADEVTLIRALQGRRAI